MSSPIRVGILGLGRGGNSMMVPGLWAVKAHLPYLLASPHFTVTAISNSSTASAQASIDFHNLAAHNPVAAYGNPQDLANDPNVDLILVSVRVQKHYELTRPALLAGKDVFVEWPLGATTSEAEELTKLAKEKGVKTIVGLQARASPLVRKLRQLIKNGEIGDILSTTVNGNFGGLPHDMWMSGAEYYLDINSGGNPLTIFFGHFLDSFTHVVGGFAGEGKEGFSAMLETKFKTTALMDISTGGVLDAKYPKTSPDHIFVQGKLESGGLASLAFRATPAGDVGDVGVRWVITGSKGELVLESKTGQWQLLQEKDCVVKIVKGKEGKEEVVDLSIGGEGEVMVKMDGTAANTAREWEAWVSGQNIDEGVVTFEDAVVNHKVLDRIREVAGK
ncbi:hypothetical protein BGZ60DRAFT_428200 [Tricladium varicosporioides]|nr:hypothetical protein BGZ60DRAFT_428200 [Hymenoscyphus varicosporioides]